jgi:hypothetical protein
MREFKIDFENNLGCELGDPDGVDLREKHEAENLVLLSL